MDFERQANEMMNAYAQVQERVLEAWLGGLQSIQPRSADTQRWAQFTERPLKALAEHTSKLMDVQVKGMLDTQAAVVQHWVKGVNPWSHLPALMDGWIRQAQEVAEHGAQVNRQVLDGCVEAGRGVDTMKVAELWSGTLQRSLDVWEEGIGRTLEAQLSMLRMEEAEEPRKRAAPGVKRTAEGKSAEERAA